MRKKALIHVYRALLNKVSGIWKLSVLMTVRPTAAMKSLSAGGKKTDGSKFCGRKTREAARPETSVWQKRRENIFIFWTVTTACSRRLTKPCMRKFAEPGPTCVFASIITLTFPRKRKRRPISSGVVPKLSIRALFASGIMKTSFFTVRLYHGTNCTGVLF